jgi:TonB family protein
LQKVTLDGHPLLRLGSVALAGKKIALPEQAWYFLADKNVLLMRTDGLETLNFTRVGELSGKLVLLDFTIKRANKILLQFKTDSMTSTTAVESAAELAVPENALPVASLGPVTVASGVMAGRKVGGANTIYPADAKRAHVQGTVVLDALIGADGLIHDLHAISSPDASLTAAAMNAARTWRYKPYLLNGEPVATRTEIHINFTFSTH